MRLLVTGLLPHDSGKTIIALNLSKALSKSLRVFYFKPIAGHNGWYQAETVKHSLEAGILVGHDAYTAARELGLLDRVRLVNPVDLLTMPPDPLKYIKSIRLYLGILADVASQTVLMRISRPLEGVDEYFIVRENARRLNKVALTVLEGLIERFSARGNVVFHDADPGLIMKLFSNREALNWLNNIYGLLSEYDVVVTESYNNAATPIEASLDSDLVLVTAPTRLLIYRGTRYRQGIEAFSMGRPPWLVDVGGIVEVLGEPLKTMDIPYVDTSEFNNFIDLLVEFITSYQ
ncbi:ATPase [Desulfurococcus amylolyticus]|uniref:Putative P-loop ATPase/GTPase n=1 Tax=Desulfurococcus amylolyticus DSM 16532 TaxID=768672 RepID=I3XRC4_DESAM|nr:ATPase [Desulfurococcus amylolyticus]AFL66498.1 putative P-loop ATPase/GTPase [Desulfurococcus amylolyticus DSM 16532]